MFKYKIFNEFELPTQQEKSEMIDFLFHHLEQYGDKKEDIEKAIQYAIKETPSFGGYIITSLLETGISGVVVINKTGMKGYIPENILVYIATHHDLRGRGIGKKLMETALSLANGDVALHVEPHNPAKGLYEKLGFTNKYLEMRYKQK